MFANRLPESLKSFAYGFPALLAVLFFLPACSDKGNGGQPPPPPEVGVIKAVASPETVNEEYAAQTEAVDTVEIRARVGGVLDRQAYVDGSHVKKGDLLFVIDQQPYLAALAQAKAAEAQVTANHINAKQIVDRIRPLLEEQAISQQDLDAAVANEAADAAAVEAAHALVTTAQLNLDYTTIRAPSAGVISKSLVKPGSLINASTTLLTTLYSIDPIYVNFTVSEHQLPELRRQLQTTHGKNQTVYHLMLGDGSEYAQSGSLNFVDAAINPATGTLQVRLSVPNPDQALRPGQFVRVLLPGQENPNAIRVPQQAVQELQGKHSVFVVDAEGKAAYREVIVNTRLGNDWLVESGLQPGETVIVEGTSKVKPGMPVKPVPVTLEATPAVSGDTSNPTTPAVQSPQEPSKAPEKSEAEPPEAAQKPTPPAYPAKKKHVKKHAHPASSTVAAPMEAPAAAPAESAAPAEQPMPEPAPAPVVESPEPSTKSGN